MLLEYVIPEYLLLLNKHFGYNTSLRQIQVGLFIYQAGDKGVSASEVANALDMPHTTATRDLDFWAGRGQAVVVTQDPDDGRRNRYTLADRSTAEIFEAWADGFEVIRRVRKIPPQERR